MKKPDQTGKFHRILCIAVTFFFLNGCSLYSEKDIIGYGIVRKVVNKDAPDVSQPIWLLKEPSLENNIKDSIFGPLPVVILVDNGNHYLIASDSLHLKGYILKGYVELDCDRTPNLCE